MHKVGTHTSSAIPKAFLWSKALPDVAGAVGEAIGADHGARDARAAASARAHRLCRASCSAPPALPFPSAPASTVGSLQGLRGEKQRGLS